MINDIFDRVSPGVGRSLFADDGVLWKRGRSLEGAVKQVQEAIGRVEEWGLEWGSRFSVEKTKVVYFTKKRAEGLELSMYGRVLERVGEFKYLGVVFDRGLTWKGHVKRVVEKGQKVVNVMRCLAGRRWGAKRSAQI